MVRPSTKSTTSESSVSRTRWARASPTSVWAVEVFIPLLHKKLPIRSHQPFHVSELGRGKPTASGQPHRIEPELRATRIALDMDVNRLVSIG
jgi:hypothetical protein